MFIKPFIALVGFVLYFSPLSAIADQTMECSEAQKSKCSHFCMKHEKFESCIIDISKRSGTCTCGDGTTHTK